MIYKYQFATVLGLVTFLLPAFAFACGDPAAIFFGFAIVVYSLIFVSVIFGVRSSTLRERARYSCYYLLSIILSWFVSTPLIHSWFDKPGQNVFEVAAHIVTPIISIVIFRLLLAKRAGEKESGSDRDIDSAQEP